MTLEINPGDVLSNISTFDLLISFATGVIPLNFALTEKGISPTSSTIMLTALFTTSKFS